VLACLLPVVVVFVLVSCRAQLLSPLELNGPAQGRRVSRAVTRTGSLWFRNSTGYLSGDDAAEADAAAAEAAMVRTTPCGAFAPFYPKGDPKGVTTRGASTF